MLFTILAAGSQGDTQPYIALGVELIKAGHRVRFATFTKYQSLIEGYGLEFLPIRGDVSMAAASLAGDKAMAADNPLKVVFSFKKLQSLVFDLQKDFYKACLGSDAIIYHPGVTMGYFAAQKLKIPSILATPFPMTPTREFPSVLFYDGPRFGGAYNRLTHQIFEQIMWSASRSPIEQFWKKEFGQKPDGFGSPFGHQTRKELPTVVSCSNYVFARPHDWPEGVYNTGYWFLNEEPDWRPPSELTSFLENGTPPVYVGFGSLGNEAQAEKTTCMVIEALRLAGQRGVLATGWNGLAKIDDLPQEIFVLESIPHSWLFPRMAAVVHHGGAGTTAAGLQAGIPSIVIPHANDQFAWGRRVYELGVGPKPVPRKKLTAENLADAIRVALTDEIKTKARELGTNIQGENGAEAAAKIIIECIETNQPMAAKLA